MISNRLVLIEQNQRKFSPNLFRPIKNYERIRYTNFAINSKYLICGASSGSLYLFTRHKNELKFLFTIPGNNGKITSIVFSKNNVDLFAFGTSRGVFKLILLKFDTLDKQQWQEIYLARNFTEHSISVISFQDDDINEFRLFLADEGYDVYMICKMKTFSSIIFKSEPPVRILSFDSPIHQLETNKQYLLVSADNNSSIFNMEKISLNKIGTKSRPTGVFGSCFYANVANDSITTETEIKFIFTARPSLRLWQANHEGNVIYTHQFKDYLNKSNCNLIYFFGDNECDQESIRSNLIRSKTKSQLSSSNFNQLYQLQIKRFTYLVTFTNAPKTMLFIINPLNAHIVFWTDQLVDPITKIMISEDELIICHRNESNNSEDRSNFDGERLFTFIKVYDLKDFVSNEEHVLSLSNLSLFCFLKENQFLIDSIIESSKVAKHIESEWMKLDATLKSIFDDLIDTIKSIQKVKSDEQNHINHNGNDVKSFVSDSLIENHFNHLLMKNGTSKDASQHLKENDEMSAQNVKKQESNVETNGFTNGKKSIDELTSKHRWKRADEPIDEKKILKKKLNELKENLDKEEINRFRCKCGNPSPRAHLLLNSKQREMQFILDKLLDDDNCDETMNACFKYGIWSMYLELLIRKHRYTECIKISLILMDIKPLSRSEVFMQNFRTDSNLCRELFGLFVKQKKLNQPNDSNNGTRAICLNCETKLQSDYIKWQDMIDFLFKNLKLDDLIDLFMIHHHQIPSTVLSSRLCIHLLQTEMIKKYESSLTNDKLIKLNQHLAIQNSKQIKTQTQIAGTKKTSWSMLLDLNKRNCDICKRPLKDYKDALLAFRCDHVYHKECEKNVSSKRICHVCSKLK